MKSAKSSVGCWTQIGIARIIVVAMASLGAAPASLGQFCQEQQKLTASDAEAFDELGCSVAISGDTAVIGARLDNDSAGSVYIFVRSGPPGSEVWTEQAKLTASDAATGDLFGRSVALSGDTVVVGAKSDDNEGGEDAGAAYVFVRSGSVWTEQAKLIASDGAGLDEFGNSVALSGDTAVVGAYGDDDGGYYAGSAYVFVRSGTVWTQQAKLTAQDADVHDSLGSSVAVSGDTAVVGAPGNHLFGQSENDEGVAYVFVRSGPPGSEVWTQQAKLTASDAADLDSFGDSVALSGDTAVIGAYYDTHAGGTAAGSAYVFVRSGEVWTQQAKLTASDAAADDQFGDSVALSGDTAVIGAAGDDHADGSDGSVYVFTRSGLPGCAVWTEQIKLTASDAVMDSDGFPISVAVSGDTAVVGAFHDDNAGGYQAGSAYVFQCLPSPGFPSAPITASDAAAGDEFGMSVAISGDTAVVGARRDDNATGVDAGAAYVYVRSGPPGNEVWTEQAKLISTNLYELAGNESGISVALSGDTALVGAWLWTFGGPGAAYVFVRSGLPGGEVWTQQAVINNPQFGGGHHGYAVALEGDTALIGSFVAPGGYGGAATFCARTGPPGGEFWMQQRVVPSDGVSGDQFGVSVAMSPSEDTAVVGAWLEDNAGGADAGSAYIYVRTEPSPQQTPWAEYTKLTASDGAAGDLFGVKVAISGDTVVVGAYTDDHAGGVDAGSAYVFTRSGLPGSEVWTEQAKLTASDAATDDYFGISLALSGDKLVVGASGDDYAGGLDAGSAYVFTRSGPPGGEVWIQDLKLTSPDPAADDWFGAAVALSGDTPVIGARQDDHAGGINAGSVYIFDLDCEAVACCIGDIGCPVNLDAYAGFQACMSGPTSPSGAGCECYDLDGDADVDLSDFAAFASVFTG